jgi:hypothetical protein
MEKSDRTARQLFEEVKKNPTRKRFGFGARPALINVDLQNAYTRVGEFVTAYETDPKQLDYVNQLARAFRAKGFPVVWTYVAYMDSGEDCGVWGTRTDTPDSLQNIKVGSRRSELDERLEVDRKRDIVINKRMASASTPWSSPAGPPPAACAPPWSTASSAATAPSSPRNAWPTSTRARTSPTSMTWHSSTPMSCPSTKC